MKYKNKSFGSFKREGFAPFRTLAKCHNALANKKQDGFNLVSEEQPKILTGFTLIELLVVVAIIALLASIALIAYTSAQEKSRNAKRLDDMAQMNTGLELYFADLRGYPPDASGTPTSLVPHYASSLPAAPQPPDGTCAVTAYNPPVPAGINPGSYYYYPSGTAYLGSDNTTMVYPDYTYYFCLGNQTGSFPSGIHMLTPEGVQ